MVQFHYVSAGGGGVGDMGETCGRYTDGVVEPRRFGGAVAGMQNQRARETIRETRGNSAGAHYTDVVHSHRVDDTAGPVNVFATAAVSSYG